MDEDGQEEDCNEDGQDTEDCVIVGGASTAQPTARPAALPVRTNPARASKVIQGYWAGKRPAAAAPRLNRQRKRARGMEE